jgi:hypothetical protein
MKKLLLLFIFNLICILSYAQSAKEMLKEIDGKWELDDNGNITFSRVIEAPNLSKGEIFNRVQSYFTYNYGSGKSVIQTQDKDAGLIVGKGIYDKVHVGMNLIVTVVDAWHILRVDVKDGKARAILTLTEYEKEISGSKIQTSYSTVKIADSYPINDKGTQKTVMSKAFYKTYKRAFATLDNLEKAIKEGNTSKSLEASDW